MMMGEDCSEQTKGRDGLSERAGAAGKAARAAWGVGFTTRSLPHEYKFFLKCR